MLIIIDILLTAIIAVAGSILFAAGIIGFLFPIMTPWELRKYSKTTFGRFDNK